MKLEPRVPPDAFACVEYLTALKRYGSTRNEVARYLILRELDDLTRMGVLPKGKLNNG